jgi:hypothetical protein
VILVRLSREKRVFDVLRRLSLPITQAQSQCQQSDSPAGVPAKVATISEIINSDNQFSSIARIVRGFSSHIRLWRRRSFSDGRGVRRLGFTPGCLLRSVSVLRYALASASARLGHGIPGHWPTCGDQPVNLPSFWEVQRVAQALNEKICERTNVRE